MDIDFHNFIPLTPAPKAVCKRNIEIEAPIDEDIQAVQVFASQGDVVEYLKDTPDGVKPSFLRGQPELHPVEVFLDNATLWLSEETFMDSFVPLPKEPKGLTYCSLDQAMILGRDEVMVYDFRTKSFLQVGSLARDPSFNPAVAEAFNNQYHMENYGIDWIGLTDREQE